MDPEAFDHQTGDRQAAVAEHEQDEEIRCHDQQEKARRQQDGAPSVGQGAQTLVPLAARGADAKRQYYLSSSPESKNDERLFAHHRTRRERRAGRLSHHRLTLKCSYP